MRKILLGAILLFSTIESNAQIKRIELEKPIKEIVLPDSDRIHGSSVFRDGYVIITLIDTKQNKGTTGFSIDMNTYKNLLEIFSKETFENNETYDINSFTGGSVSLRFVKKENTYDVLIAILKGGLDFSEDQVLRLSISQVKWLFDVK